MAHFELVEKLAPNAVIKVIGVGGCGGNAVRHMMEKGVEGVEFIVANTDAQALNASEADRRIQLGLKITQGLGAGSRPEIGRAAAEETLEEIEKALEGAHMCFIAAGMGGGGEVPVGGGLLLKGSAYGIVRLSDVLGLTLEGGVMKAPQGELTAPFASASLLWVLEDRFDAGQSALATRTEWILGLERYEAARRDGSERTLDAVVLKINRFLSPHFYLTGQAHSALSGGAGGYSVGLFGLGVQTPLGARFHAGAELLAGAAGGGGVDTTGRLLAQKLSERWGHPVVVENRGGAGGSIGSDIVAKAQPDGHTILLGSTAQRVQHSAPCPVLVSRPKS